MINDNVPTNYGLDLIVEKVINSKEPLKNLLINLHPFLIEEGLMKCHGALGLRTAKQLMEHIIENDEYFELNDLLPPLLFANDHVRLGLDYLLSPKEKLLSAFSGGDQTYHLLDVEHNCINPSFAILLFPEITTTIPEKKSMMKEYGSYYPRNYNHVKTLLISRKDDFYLVCITGDEKLNFSKLRKKIKNMQGLSKKLSRIKIADVEPLEVIGRERGAIGPFIYKEKLGNIKYVLIDEKLMKRWSKPHFTYPIDRTSGVVVSNTQDLIDTLRDIEGFPEIQIYNN